MKAGQRRPRPLLSEAFASVQETRALLLGEPQLALFGDGGGGGAFGALISRVRDSLIL